MNDRGESKIEVRIAEQVDLPEWKCGVTADHYNHNHDHDDGNHDHNHLTQVVAKDEESIFADETSKPRVEDGGRKNSPPYYDKKKNDKGGGLLASLGLGEKVVNGPYGKDKGLNGRGGGRRSHQLKRRKKKYT
jgi:hypothetical protein